MSNKAKEELKDILAIMHGDGGHYTLKHGLKKSYQDAIKDRNIMVAKIDSLQQENKRLRDALTALYACSIVAKHPEDLKSFYGAQDMARQALGESCEK